MNIAHALAVHNLARLECETGAYVLTGAESSVGARGTEAMGVVCTGTGTGTG